LIGTKSEDMLKRLGSLLALDHESEPQNTVELTEVMQQAKEQIEYYLSAGNLEKDKFMREQTQAGEEGFIDLGIFLNCNRIKQLGISGDDLLFGCSRSHFLVADLERQRIKPKTKYVVDSRRRQKTVRISGFALHETVDSIFDIVSQMTTEPENIILQYVQNDSGERTFTGVAIVLYFSEEAADRAVETPIFMGEKPLFIEHIIDYEQRLKKDGIILKK
jgi:hypothetical protein